MRLVAFCKRLSKDNINEVDESIGFSFNHPPVVEAAIKKSNENVSIIISGFECKEPMSGRTKEEKKLSEFETLSAIFVDNNYDGNAFSITDVFFPEDLDIDKENVEISFDKSDVGTKMMMVFIDIFGNEFKEEFEV